MHTARRGPRNGTWRSERAVDVSLTWRVVVTASGDAKATIAGCMVEAEKSGARSEVRCGYT